MSGRDRQQGPSETRPQGPDNTINVQREAADRELAIQLSLEEGEELVLVEIRGRKVWVDRQGRIYSDAESDSS